MATVPPPSHVKTFFLGLHLLFWATHLFFHVSSNFTAAESPLHKPASTHRPTPITIVKRFGAVYGAQIFMGSTGVKNILSMSTTSSFNWVLCEPCSCYDTRNVIFNPVKSTTYVELNCRHQYCSSFREKECDDNKCKFTFRYPDGDAYVNGILSQDKFKFQSTHGAIEVHDFTFGCTHKTHGTFSEDNYGIIGLGRGALSIVSQFRHGIFSYCLPSMIRKEGWLNFYPVANDPDDGAVIIPLVDDDSNLYKVSINSIVIIGAEDEPIIMTKPHSGSIFVIDTSTLLSYIEDYWMQILLEVVKWNTPFPTVFHSQYDICFNISTNPPKKQPPLPWMKLEFARRAVVILNPSNLFVQAGPHVACFTFVTIRRIGREEGFILGSHALKGRKMVIDGKINKVTFGRLLENC